jgi:hypothetical protein
MLNTIIQILVKILSLDLIKGLIPAKFRPFLDKFDRVLPLAATAIAMADNIKGADNAAKKKAAAEHLLKELQAAKVDIPGDADLDVCAVFVEGVYQAFKAWNPTSAK